MKLRLQHSLRVQRFEHLELGGHNGGPTAWYLDDGPSIGNIEEKANICSGFNDGNSAADAGMSSNIVASGTIVNPSAQVVVNQPTQVQRAFTEALLDGYNMTLAANSPAKNLAVPNSLMALDYTGATRSASTPSSGAWKLLPRTVFPR